MRRPKTTFLFPARSLNTTPPRTDGQISGAVDLAPLVVNRRGNHIRTRPEKTGQHTCHVKPVPFCERPEITPDGAPTARGEFQQSHILALDIFDSVCLATNLQKLAGIAYAKSLRIRQRIFESPAPEIQPPRIICNGDVGGSRHQLLC